MTRNTIVPTIEPRRTWLSGWVAPVVACVIGAAIGAVAILLWSGPLVRSALVDNPEIIDQAIERLQEREVARVVSANRAALETPFAGAWAGAADGDVVMVEFFDYSCPYCRRTNADVDRVLREDRKLKLVWREYPVLGPDSEAASLASLAAAASGRYRLFHDALFAAGRPSAPALAGAEKTAGVSPERVARMKSSPDARAELSRNYQLARAISAIGTPTFVVGDRVLQGAVGYDALKAAVIEARAQR